MSIRNGDKFPDKPEAEMSLWQSFTPSSVDPFILRLVKTAALIEGNSADYVDYLDNVFVRDDAERHAIARWGEEEKFHGKILGGWAQKADLSWSYQDALVRFRELYHIPKAQNASVRGSRAGEMLARCIVEIGTSSFYLALADGTHEPVLKEICQKIARDEFKHFGLFYSYLKSLASKEDFSFWQRVKIVTQRITETGDDELAAAYFCANYPKEARYDRTFHGASYLSNALSYYRDKHVSRIVRMIAHVMGVKMPHNLQKLVAFIAMQVFRSRERYFQKKVAYGLRC